MRRRFLYGVFCAAILVVGAAPGLADNASFRDNNDAYGRLDVKWISHGHVKVDGRKRLMHKIETYGTWNKNSFSQDASFIHLLFTTDGDNRPERALVVDVKNGHWTVEMHSWRGGEVRDYVFGRGHASRPNARTVRITFRRALLGNGVTEYGWHVDTQFHHTGHPHCGTEKGVIIVCPDSAPDGTKPYSYLRHEL